MKISIRIANKGDKVNTVYIRYIQNNKYTFKTVFATKTHGSIAILITIYIQQPSDKVHKTYAFLISSLEASLDTPSKS